METQRISHYQIRRLIARGGMGEVYEAEDLDLGRPVALKFIAPELAADAQSLRRFEREALAAAALNHPHIAIVHAFERSAERPFLAMELLSGTTLRTRLDAGPLPLGDAVAIVRDVAGALAYAHRREVVHRDIKPENLMFDEHGQVKVTDFGLARVARASAMTTTGSILGTPHYMAPESVNGESGAAADVWALGVVFHEMLAGQPPFGGDQPLAVMYAIANQDPPSLCEARPETPDEILSLIGDMLIKDPARRPSADQVSRRLGGSAEARSSTEGLSRSETPTGVSPGRRLSRRALVGAAAALIVAAAAWGLQSRAATRHRLEALALNNQGMEALQRSDAARAQMLFERALRQNPGLGRAMLNLGAVYQDQGKLSQAESLFTAVLRRHRADRELVALARYNLGSMDLDQGAWESAVENLGTSFQADSSLPRAYNNYGLALVRVGRAHDALALLERGIRRFPTVAPLFKNAGLAALELGQTMAAVRHLDRALELDPGLEEARTLRAMAAGRRSDSTLTEESPQ